MIKVLMHMIGMCFMILIWDQPLVRASNGSFGMPIILGLLGLPVETFPDDWITAACAVLDTVYYS